MGEKPTASEEAAARDMGIGSVSERGGTTAVRESSGGGMPTERQAHEAAHTAQQQAGRIAVGDVDDDALPDNAKSGGKGDSGAAEATNLNSSKSNTARKAPDRPEETERTNLNSSRSNIDDESSLREIPPARPRPGAAEPSGPGPAEPSGPGPATPGGGP